MTDSHQNSNKKRESKTKPILHPQPQLGQESVQQSAPPDGLLPKRMQAKPQSLNPHQVLQLQRMVGNRATARLLGRETRAVVKPSFSFSGSRLQRDDEDDKEQDETPSLSFEDLEKRHKKAEDSTDLQDKTDFLAYFSEHYAPMLTGEIEYLQFLAHRLAYLKLEVGDEIGAHVDTDTIRQAFDRGPDRSKQLSERDKRSPIDSKLSYDKKQTDEKSEYAGGYTVARTYKNPAGLNAMLLLPADEDKSQNAIVLFRGTGKHGLGDEYDEASGALADIDPVGPGYTAFAKGLETMKQWLDMAKAYDRITITGHSLGGAMAQRFYVLASKEVPGKLRLVTYQAAAIDRMTADKVRSKKDPQLAGAKVTRVVARGDVVPLAGDAHAPGDKLKFTDPSKRGPLSSHTQLSLVEQQLKEQLDEGMKLIYKDVVVHKKTGGRSGARALTGTVWRGLGSGVGGSLYTLFQPHRVIEAVVDSGTEEGD